MCVGGEGTEFMRNQLYVRNMVISVAFKKTEPILGASSGVNGTLNPGASACPQRVTVCVCVCVCVQFAPTARGGCIFLYTLGGYMNTEFKILLGVARNRARASVGLGGGATGDQRGTNVGPTWDQRGTNVGPTWDQPEPRSPVGGAL